MSLTRERGELLWLLLLMFMSLRKRDKLNKVKKFLSSTFYKYIYLNEFGRICVRRKAVDQCQ